MRTFQPAALALAIFVLLAAVPVLGTPPAWQTIALTTDKTVYTLGETVFLSGRGYGYPDQTLMFFFYIDQHFQGGTLRNAAYGNFTVAPPTWSFVISWQPASSGNYSAYITGPNHSGSAELRFQVLKSAPIPEFYLAPVLLLAVLVASVLVMRHRQ